MCKNNTYVQWDPFLVIPLAVDRTDILSSAYSYYTPTCSAKTCTTYEVVIVTATGDASSVYMNGTLLPRASFTAVAGNTYYSTTRIGIKAGFGAVCQSAGCPIAVYLYGYLSNEAAGTVVPGVPGVPCNTGSVQSAATACASSMTCMNDTFQCSVCLSCAINSFFV